VSSPDKSGSVPLPMNRDRNDTMFLCVLGGMRRGVLAESRYKGKNCIKTPRLIPPYPHRDCVIPIESILRVCEGLTSEGSPPFGRE